MMKDKVAFSLTFFVYFQKKKEFLKFEMRHLRDIIKWNEMRTIISNWRKHKKDKRHKQIEKNEKKPCTNVSNIYNGNGTQNDISTTTSVWNKCNNMRSWHTPNEWTDEWYKKRNENVLKDGIGATNQLTKWWRSSVLMSFINHN